jgi:hypothetical protein
MIKSALSAVQHHQPAEWKVVTKQKVAKNVDTGTALMTKANAGQFG